MKWLSALIVIIAIIASFLIELYWLSFLLVMLLVLVVFVELAKGTAKVGVKTGKVLTKGMWTGLEKAQPKAPSGEIIKDISKQLGKTAGENIFAPPEYKYQSPNLDARLGDASSSLLKGLKKLFGKGWK